MLLLAALQHVVVDNIRTNIAVRDSAWAIFAAGAAAAAAIATFFLAWLTRNLAAATTEMAHRTADLSTQTANQVNETVAAIEQAQRHHEQSLMPLVSLQFDCTMETEGPRKWIHLRGDVINVGPGPATAVYLHLSTMAYVPQYAIYLGLIGANSRKELNLKYETTTTQYVAAIPYKCVTRHRTIFDTEGAIAQDSHSGLGRDIKVSKYFQPSDSSKAEIDEYLRNEGLSTTIVS